MQWNTPLLLLLLSLLVSCTKYDPFKVSTHNYTGTVHVQYKEGRIISASGYMQTKILDTSYTEFATVRESADSAVFELPTTQKLFYTYRKAVWFRPSSRQSYHLSVVAPDDEIVFENMFADDHSLTCNIHWIHGYLAADYVRMDITFAGIR